MKKNQIVAAEFVFDGYTLHQNASVEYNLDGTIVRLRPATEAILPGLVMPAFINAHCHLELSHLKGQIPKHTGLVDFLLNINSLRANPPEEEIHLNMQEAEKAMIENGIAAVGDISNKTDSLAIKKNKKLNYHTFVETFGLSEEKSLDRFSQSLFVFNAFQKLLPTSLVLHAPYSISESLLKLADDFNRNKISTFHNQECDAENELIQDAKGDFLRLLNRIIPGFVLPPKHKPSLQYMLEKLDHTKHLILVHNTVTNLSDVKNAKKFSKDLFWCLCPNANLYIENKLPDINMLKEQNCKIVLGTDSLASNDSLSIWSELCTIKKHFPYLKWSELLRWSTIHGAEALQMNHMLGSFEKGKKPGIIHLPYFNMNEILSPDMSINWIAPFAILQ